MGDYKRAAQMFLKFAGPMSPSGRALSAISNFSGVGQMEGAVSHKTIGSQGPKKPNTITPSLRTMNEGEQAMAKQEMKSRRNYKHGGAVSHKSISACEKAMRAK